MNRPETGIFDYEFYVEKNANVNAKVNKFLRAVPAIGDREVITAQLNNAIDYGLHSLEWPQTTDTYIVGKVIHVRHYVDPIINKGKNCFIYRINIFM